MLSHAPGIMRSALALGTKMLARTSVDVDAQPRRRERADLLHQHAHAAQVVVGQARVGDEARPLVVVGDVEHLAVAAGDAPVVHAGARGVEAERAAGARARRDRARRGARTARPRAPPSRRWRARCARAWIQRLRSSVAPHGKSRRTMLPVSTTRSKRRLPFSASSTSSASQVPKLWAIRLTRLAPVRSIRSRSSLRSHCTRLARVHGSRNDSTPKKP